VLAHRGFFPSVRGLSGRRFLGAFKLRPQSAALLLNSAAVPLFGHLIPLISRQNSAVTQRRGISR
jgi:hypothetical protein